MNQCPHCGRYIDDRPKGDFSKKIPSTSQFQRDFAEPMSFGDEDEHVLISKDYTEQEALEKIQQLMKDQWGWSEDESGYPKDINDLRSYQVGWGFDYDSYQYSEGCYWIADANSQVTPRWNAWGVETQ